jgi:hypothetical protein
MHFKKNQNISANIPNIIGDKAMSIVDRLYKFICNESTTLIKKHKFTILKETIKV